MSHPSSSSTAGSIYAATAFILWGILPIYWKFLKSVPPLEILCHRIFWSFLFVCLLLATLKKWKLLHLIFFEWHRQPLLFGASLLISINWFTYIYAVNSGRVLETSLGYYINPLVNVLLGMIFLGEKHSLRKKTAIFLATVGVLYLTLSYGRLPWIALVLALSFGFYSLFKKLSPTDSLAGLGLETLYLFLPAMGYMIYLAYHGSLALFQEEPSIQAGLVLAGVVTILPLVLFASAAKRLSMATLGFFLYLSPSCTFLLAVFVYGEPFTLKHIITFSCIWLALAIYSTGNIPAKKGDSVPAISESGKVS